MAPAVDVNVIDAAMDGAPDEGPPPDMGPLADQGAPLDMAPDMNPPDAGFAPPPPTLGAPLDVVPEAITPDAIDAFVLLDAQTLLLTDADGLWRLDGAVQTRLGAAPETLDAAVWFDDTAVLAADGAIWIVEADGVVRSPLSEVVGTATDLAVMDGALWIASDTGLHRFADGMIMPILPEALPTASARLTATDDGLWVGTPQGIYALDAESAQPTGAVASDAAVVDASGVWAVGDARLWWLDDDFYWWPIALPMQPQAAAAHPATPGVWLTDGAQVWLLTDGTLVPYRGAPGGPMIADGEGAVLINTPDGLVRVAAERFVQVDPLPDRITRATEATIRPALPDQVESVEATIDGNPVAVIGRDPWTVELSPVQGEGPHVLGVTVTWTDGVQSESAIDFVAHTVNWTDDIQPLSAEACAQCHGVGGTAHPLHAAAQWSAEIDQIIDAVSTGRMPLALPSLSDAQIMLITDWLDAGLPEDRP